jgi:hypothetical protein
MSPQDRRIYPLRTIASASNETCGSTEELQDDASRGTLAGSLPDARNVQPCGLVACSRFAEWIRNRLFTHVKEGTGQC